MQVLKIRSLTAVILGLTVCFFVHAKTLVVKEMDPSAVTVSKDDLVVPESAFHNWQESSDQASVILSAWKDGQALTIPWTQLQLQKIVKHKTMPTRAARGLALTHVAMHDAYELAIKHSKDPKLVVSMAVAQTMAYLFIAEEKAFDRIAFSVASKITGHGVHDLPLSAKEALILGRIVGQMVVKYADTDGAQKGWNGVRLQYYGEGRYYGPGTWEPTPPYFYYPPDEPFAPNWRTWVLKSAGQFRPTPPPYGSKRYLNDLQEVITIANKLTEDERAIAKKWVDGYGSITPPGHWNQIAIEEAKLAKTNDQKAIDLFASLNIALADTFIAVWDTKYYYWTARPITSAQYLLGEKLRPAILTPPFPSYVSGHAAFSGAASTILGQYFPQRKLHFESMASEAAHSRLLGGIHYRFDNEDGLLLGKKVAGFVIQKMPN